MRLQRLEKLEVEINHELSLACATYDCQNSDNNKQEWKRVKVEVSIVNIQVKRRPYCTVFLSKRILWIWNYKMYYSSFRFCSYSRILLETDLDL